MAGLYIHIPFCRQACTYCDFHFSTSGVYRSAVVDGICKELELRKDYLDTNELISVYLGGGTPSQLKAVELDSIMSSANKHFNIAKNAEITLEGNPDDLSKEYLKDLKSVGINRLSIGIQSFRNEDLNYMNRAHTAYQAEKSVLDAAYAGFEKMSVDLIYGIPGLDTKSWISNFKKAAALPVDHLSCYSLTVEEGTPLSKYIKTGKSPKVDDDHAAEQFELLQELAAENNFDHYEISNLARNGAYAIHNSAYWKGLPYLGIGPSAHSFNGNSRRINIANNQRYIKGIINENESPNEVEVIDLPTRYNELVLTGLRTKNGISKTDLIKLGKEYIQHFRKEALELPNKEWLIETESNFSLTPKAWLQADGIAGRLFM